MRGWNEPVQSILVKRPLSSAAEPRRIAASLVHQVVDRGESLASILVPQLSRLEDQRQRALVQELSFGSLRWFHRLDAMLARLLKKPLKTKDRDIHALLLVGLYQLMVLSMPAHAAVSETVEAARQSGKDWAAGLVNAVLRNAQRRAEELVKAVDDMPAARWSHPEWWIEQLQKDWPDDWQNILEADNQRPPMALRVNRLRVDREAYLEQLRQAGIEAQPLAITDAAIELREAVGVDSLPGFSEGLVTVQDGAAQLSALLLEPKTGQRVLDACAAPGGKTGHLLELEPDLRLLAIDKDERRLAKVQENLQRLQLKAELRAADAGEPGQWWDGKPFDRILLDAPCSASGVVRRHPDIKLLRRPDDLKTLAKQQQRLLDALWPLLVPGGILLYVTCSVFRQENSECLQAFMGRHADASELGLHLAWGTALPVGRQLLPGQHGVDGFYFARLIKASATPQ